MIRDFARSQHTNVCELAKSEENMENNGSE